MSGSDWGRHSKSCCKTPLGSMAVASARRSGQEELQRGTPPVSLASYSISPFLRACIITEWSSKDHETDSTETSILIPLLLLNFNMRLHGNPTAWYLFLATEYCLTNIARVCKFVHHRRVIHSLQVTMTNLLAELSETCFVIYIKSRRSDGRMWYSP